MDSVSVWQKLSYNEVADAHSFVPGKPMLSHNVTKPNFSFPNTSCKESILTHREITPQSQQRPAPDPAEHALQDPGSPHTLPHAPDFHQGL